MGAHWIGHLQVQLALSLIMGQFCVDNLQSTGESRSGSNNWYPCAKLTAHGGGESDRSYLAA